MDRRANGSWSRTLKRIVCVWLTQWPITAWAWSDPARVAPAEPFALVENGARGRILAGLNPAARAAGLRLGQAHADACAILPTLASAPFDPAESEAALRRLAAWMQRFSPLVALDPGSGPGMEGLLLDVTGVAHLFGGEAALGATLIARLRAMGAPARVGIADTPGAAWALARFAAGPDAPAIAGAGGAREALDPLPVVALRLDAEAVRLLARFGVRRIGDLHRLPREALARRFRGAEGLAVVRRLDQALGVSAEPLRPVAAPAQHRVQQSFVEPLIAIPGVIAAARGLAGRLGAALEREGLGARRLCVTGFRSDGGVTTLEAALAAASRAPAHWLRLLQDRGWEQLDLGFGLDVLMMSAPVVEPLRAVQIAAPGDVSAAPCGPPPGLAPLIDRLTARLGERAVLRPEFAQSWLPERAERLRPWGEISAKPTPAAGAGAGGPQPRRPLLLFDPPEPIETLAGVPDGAPRRFVWRRVTHQVARASGPERLADEWWRPAPSGRPPRRTRDYYKLEDETGARYWVFRDGLPGAEDETRPSNWWLHGLFA